MTVLLVTGAVAPHARTRSEDMTADTPTSAASAFVPADSTRALFRYERNDASPDHITRVRINAGHTARHAIDPRVFGNFIEHLGGVVYEGLWAQILLNPNLERIEPGDKTPAAWELTGAAAWQEGGYSSPFCVQLQAPDGTLSQVIHPPLHRTNRYTLTCWLRAPQGQAVVEITLRGVGEQATVTRATTKQTVETGEWTKATLHLTPETKGWKKGAACAFVVRHIEGKAVEVDQITLTPDDNVDGLDPDVVKRAEAWHIPLLRYPGGNFVSGYDWQDGVGPREARPTRRNPAWGGIEPHHFGTDEFLRFCRLLKTEPQITVNAGDGTPENAAAWVRYCNGDANTDDWARKRRANGHAEPYHIALWEVGNELYGDWQIGHTNAEGNAERYVRFREAMLRADPNLVLIATGKGDEFTSEGWERCRHWNELLLRAALANGGHAPDYLSIHPLVPLPGLLPGSSYAEQYESAMAHPTLLDDVLLPDLIRQITEIAGPNAKTRIAPTEWGIIVGGDKWWESPNHDVHAGAIFNALTLNAFLRHSDWVTLANMTAFMHGGGIKKPNGVVIVDPQYWTQELYAAARPHTPVQTLTNGPGHDVPARGQLPAVSNVPDVDVFAALTQDTKSLVVFAVNRHRTEARPLRLNVEDFAASAVSATLLDAPDPQTRNTIEHPDAVAPRPFSVPAIPPNAHSAWQVTLPPHALVVLTLKR